MADTYDVVTITPQVRAAPGGLFTHVQQVTFVTKPSGITGQVDIPLDTFDADTVAPILADAAAKLEAVKAL